MTITCPECTGPQMEGHPGGRLEYVHVPNGCTLLTAEDATRAADLERHRDLYPYGFTRPATATEIALLAGQGFTVPATLTTHVGHITPGVRCRTWDLVA